MASSTDSIQLYRQMLKLDPDSRVFALLAEELCSAGRWEEAADVCRKGLQSHPDHLRSRVLLGWALMEMGEADESGAVLQQIVEEICHSSMIFKLLSEFATFSGDPDRAAAFFKVYDAFQAPNIQMPESGVTVAPVFASEAASEATAGITETEERKRPLETSGAAVFEAVEPAVEQMAESVAVSPPERVLMEVELDAPEEAEPPAVKSPGLSGILAGLADAIELRFSAAPSLPPMLSGADKDFLKRAIMGELAAAAKL